MRNTIGKKITVVILAPSLLILGLLSAVIAYSASQIMAVWAEDEIKDISEINASELTGRMHPVRISVLSAASALETLDAKDENGRARAESIVKSMLENPHVHSAWLAYEPEAFDSRDAEHTSDYAGAPSGRFIRSYAVDDGQIVTVPDMDENTLDDPAKSPWYTKPRDTGSFYTEARNDTPDGTGDATLCTVSFAAPVYRGGRVIGCVGADMSFDMTAPGAGDAKQSAAAVFYPDGRVLLPRESTFADASVDTLGFTKASEIRASFSEGIPLFLPDEYSAFLNTKAVTYFQPVAVSEADNLYLYTAMPRSGVFNGLKPVLMLIAGIVASALVFILFIIIYVKRKISDPLSSLILAADAVSSGDLETEILSFPDSTDEIGVLSQSLQRLVEQLRIYILRLEQTREEKTIYSKLDELLEAGGISRVMKGLSALLCERFNVDKSTAVCLSEGGARVLSRREAGADDIDDESPPDFLHHTQITPLLAGKKLLLMNAYVISEKNAGFLDGETRFACVLPLRDGHRVLGYVILESRSIKNPFGARSEPILCGIAETIVGFMMEDKKEPEIPQVIPAEPTTGNSEDQSPDTVRDVEGLDSAAAIRTMGGMDDLYEQALNLMTKLLPETIEKLDVCLAADMDAFIIEIHALKGSLNNVGAYGMGTRASYIEQAAKVGDNALCLESYAAFKEALTDFHRRIVTALKTGRGKSPGDVRELVALLPEAEKTVTGGDCAAALNLLRPMGIFSFDPKTDVLLGDIITSLDAAEIEKALEDVRRLREKLAHWEEI